MGYGEKDDKEVTILGRIVRWKSLGIEYEADPKHRRLVLEYFGFAEGTKALSFNGDKEDKEGDKEGKEPGTESFNIQKEKASSIGASVNLLGRKSARLMKIFLKFECIFSL